MAMGQPIPIILIECIADSRTIDPFCAPGNAVRIECADRYPLSG
jgi:hypothetical protein